MEGKFIVRNARFHRLDPHVYVLQGSCRDNTLEGKSLEARIGKEKLPVQITFREGLLVRQQYFSVPSLAGMVDREYFIWITLPEKVKSTDVLKVVQVKDRERATVFRTTGLQLNSERDLPENYLETWKKTDEGISIGGWAVGRGPCRVGIKTRDGEKIPCKVTRHYRREIVEEFPELEDEGKEQKYGYEVTFKEPEERFLKLVVYGGRRGIAYRIDLKKDAKGVQGLGNSLAGKTLQYLRRNGLARTVSKVAEKTAEKLVGKKTDYMAWREKAAASREELAAQRQERFDDPPLISIVVPLYKTPEKYLTELVGSVREQTYSHWELCLSDGSGKDSPLNELLDRICAMDERIRVISSDDPLRIAENTNAAIGIASGSWIAFADHDDLLAPDALYEVAKRIVKDPDAELIYTDEDKVSMDSQTYFEPHFKTDYNPDLLCSMNYICHLCVIKKELLDRVGLLDPAFDGAQDYDLVLRAAEQASGIVHIPKALYHWRSHEGSTAQDPASKRYAFEAGKRAVEAHYQRTGIPASVEEGEYPGLYVTLYRVPSDGPMISVIIPNKDHTEDLERCVVSLEERSAYRRFEIIVVENNSTDEATFAYYRSLQARYPNVKVVNFEGEFNYPLVNNSGAEAARGDYLLFLNNDTEMIRPDGLLQLLGPCMREEVGCVGALLLYPDDTIQHAGVIIGYGGIAGHAFQGMKYGENGYFSRIICQSDLSAVTAACMMIRKSVYEKVGGFDPVFKVAFNDVDLCLRLRREDLLVVYNPQALFYHYESRSRGYEDTSGKIERFNKEAEELIRRWGDLLREGDPFYNPNLTLDSNDFSLRRLG